MVIKITPDGMPALWVVEVATTNFGGHPPDYWADRLTEKIVGYSETKEPHINEQAKAYRDAIREVCLIYIKNAIKSYKASLIQELIEAGDEDLEKIIKRI